MRLGGLKTMSEFPVTFEEVVAARERIAPYLPRTPLYEYPGLSKLLGFPFYLKHENHQPVGAFKVRGGVNLISQLSDEEKARGVLCATRGNHGQSVAYAAKLFGVQAVVVIPEGNNPEKNAAMEDLGADLVVHGKDFDEAVAKAEELKAEHGYRYVHSANDPKLIAGVGTYALEIFETLEAVDAIIVPIGLGSGISGVSIVAKKLSPSTRIIGVQAEKAPAVCLSWREKKIVTTESADTIADGLATRVPASTTLDIINRCVDDIVLLSEQEIIDGIGLLLRETHNLAEGAGAASTAAAFKLRDKLKGKRVVGVLSGGNIDRATLKTVLEKSRF
jgi:threonine dehydratase